MLETTIIICLFIVFGVMAVNAILEMRRKSKFKKQQRLENEREVVPAAEGDPSPAPYGSPSYLGGIAWGPVSFLISSILISIILAWTQGLWWLAIIPVVLFLLTIYGLMKSAGESSRIDEIIEQQGVQHDHS